MKKLHLLPVLFCLCCWFTGYGQAYVVDVSKDSLKNDRLKHDLLYKNLIAVAPILHTENGLGFGLCYERFLGKRGRVSIYVPLYISWNKNDIQMDSIANHSKVGYMVSNSDPLFCIAPGIKLNAKLVNDFATYSIGASCLIGSGTTTASENGQWTYNFGVTEGGEYHRSLNAIMIDNALNLTPGKRIVITFDAFIGATLSNKTNGTEQGMEGLYCVSIRLGYRFKKPF